jgi:hypothetical protein
MIMNDLQLHRAKELVEFKARMANSITQFTRRFIMHKNSSTTPERDEVVLFSSTQISATTQGNGPAGWKKGSPTSDKHEEGSGLGIMSFYDLEVAQKIADACSVTEQTGVIEVERSNANSVDPDPADATNQHEELKFMYHYACHLMRETLDVEGVCLVEVSDIGSTNVYPHFSHVTRASALNHPPPASSSVRGYSHSEKFGARQRNTWPPISRWDEETNGLNPEMLQRKTQASEVHHVNANSPILFETQFPDTSPTPSESKPDFAAGSLSDRFITEFMSNSPTGEAFSRGLPDEIRSFLPAGVKCAMLVPVYNDHTPFAFVCAYSTNKLRLFLDEENRYCQVRSL